MCVRLHRYPPLCINTYTWLVQIDYAEHISQSAGEFICTFVLWALTCALCPVRGGLCYSTLRFIHVKFNKKQRCRQELFPFLFSGTSSKTQTGPSQIFLFFFILEDRSILSDSRLHLFETSRRRLSSGFISSFRFRPLLYNFITLHRHSLKGRDQCKYQDCASQQLYNTPHLEDEERGVWLFGGCCHSL